MRMSTATVTRAADRIRGYPRKAPARQRPEFEPPPFGDRLRNQKAIKRIIMMSRQGLERHRMREAHRQLRKLIRADRGDQFLQIDGKPAQHAFDRNLPDGSRADSDTPLRDDLSHRSRQPPIRIQPPEKNVGIEREPHRSSSSKKPGGSGASKSRPIRMRPRRRPGFRFTAGGRIGPKRAAGRPLRAMMISSPASARSTSAERRVLAS